ncbi:FixH family protein [Limobrevibacterium gyesilva]|uniref:FixH family protein n=1 Tax=Limobrevibacterium gyesilva TaxID=2991712 RepID=A0AA42CJC4_9PROT|nr:FixH family protein [Limobrevibacterium gyesilva]MCW3476762.1 FixH family protein [Limobrevibacterium gyesilva]
MPTIRSTPFRSAPASPWRFFPWVVAGAMGVVILVNLGMAYSAVHGFPGLAADDVFDRSNAYDKVLAASQRQAALGWSLAVSVEAGRPVVLLTGREGQPLEGARLSATARRPLGAETTSHVVFRATAPGRYVAEAPLAEPGQWDLLIAAASGQQTLRSTHRVVVR